MRDTPDGLNVKDGRLTPSSSPSGEGSRMRDTPDVKCKKRGEKGAKKCMFSLFGLCLNVIVVDLKNYYNILDKGLLI